MSKPFICSGCRVRLAIRPRHLTTAERRPRHRDLTTSSNSRHAFQSLSQPTERRDFVPPERESRDDGREHGHPVARGRYSGQPLRPQFLLEELNRTETSHKIRQQRGQQSRRNDGYSTGIENVAKEQERQPQLKALMAQLVGNFCKHVDNAELEKAWQSLLTMRHEVLGNEEAQISNPRAMVKRLHQFMRRIVVHHTKPVDPSEASMSIPTPRAFVLLVRDLNLLSPAMRSELLWRLSNGLAMRFYLDGDIDQASESLALHELVSIWYETLEAKGQRNVISRTNLTENSPQDWSILPPASSITKQSNGLPMHLHEVLALLLPTNTTEGGVEAVADYQSSLLLTFDLLNAHLSSGADKASASAIVGQWRPFVVFLTDVLNRIIKPSVPPAITVRLEQSQDPVLEYYETLVRRLDLADVPAIRTDRSKAATDLRRIKLNELGLPLAKPAINVKQRKGNNNTASAAAPQSSDAGQMISDIPEKESLVEAGFSVSEQMDMSPRLHHRVFGWVKRLGRSIEGDNLLITEACWKEVCAFTSRNAAKSTLPLFLYEHFMLAFLTLRQPRMAIEIWNALLKAGLQPTVKTWTVMMRGCSRANDADTMEMFWARMKDQGVQPDQHAWSTRIYCLLKVNRLNKAFPALREMGQNWIDAVRNKQRASLAATMGNDHTPAKLPEIDLTQWNGEVDGVPCPNLVIINSAVAALAQKADDQIPRVLSWARDFAIDLDLTTYNALLNVSMRHGKTAEALSILKLMQNRAIQPDSTTVTVLLTALFESDVLTHLSAEEQTAKLFSLISEIETTSTAKLDQKGYALIIDRMLKQHDNPGAARAMLEHMSALGVEPSFHIYTILMTSYFQANPPDFAAAETLWSRIQGSNAAFGSALDTIFYDRMVEAYAQNHVHVGIAPMMQFLRRMSREGKRPGWPMLECVARALAERSEWGLLQGLVSDIRESKGLVRVGVRGLVGQNEFWRFIIGTGLLDSEGITDEQQLRKGAGGSSFWGLQGNTTA